MDEFKRGDLVFLVKSEDFSEEEWSRSYANKVFLFDHYGRERERVWGYIRTLEGEEIAVPFCVKTYSSKFGELIEQEVFHATNND